MTPMPKSYEDHGADDPTAAPAALGLTLLAIGGWLLTTARPWQKPGHPLTLGLGWTASGALLLCGLVLLGRCVRTVHGDNAPDPGTATNADG
ncbi:hypothetical protein [Streptomyces sp. NPDC054787]